MFSDKATHHSASGIDSAPIQNSQYGPDIRESVERPKQTEIGGSLTGSALELRGRCKGQHDRSLTNKIVQIFLEHGANVNAQNSTYSTPLHLATSSESVETMQLLLEHCAYIDALDISPNTSVHLALRVWQMTQLLI
jgi:ankyrin repeat protein